MSILGDKIKEAGSNRERNACHFTLNDEEFVIYAKPITGMDVEAITRRHKNFASNPTLAAAVDMIIRKAEDEDGTKAFDIGDKPILLNQTVDFIANIRNQLFPDEDVDLTNDAIEDEVKN